MNKWMNEQDWEAFRDWWADARIKLPDALNLWLWENYGEPPFRASTPEEECDATEADIY